MDASMTWALRVGNVALLATCVMSLLFVAVYSFQPWWQRESGRIIMALMMSIMLVTGLGLLRAIVGESEWFLWVRVLVFVTVPITIGRCVWLLVRVQYRTESTLDDDESNAPEYDGEHDTVD